MKAILISIVALLVGYLFVLHRTDANESDCLRETSSDGRYIAEECLLVWDHGDNPKYVGRVYEAESGTLIIRRTLYTKEPRIIWVDNHLLFQAGGEDEDVITLPPSVYDRIVAAYWRLTTNR